MFTNMSIARKLVAGFACLTVLVLGLVGFAINQLSQVYQVTSKITGNVVPSLTLASEMQETLLTARRSEMRSIIAYLDKNDADLKASFTAYDKAKEAYLQTAARYGALHFANDEERTAYGAIQSHAEAYFAAHASLQQALLKGDAALIQQTRNTSKALLDQAADYALQLRQINMKVSDDSAKTVAAVYDSARFISLGAGLVVVLFVICVAWVLTSQIRRPLALLLEQTRKVSRGELTTHLQLERFNQDEFGALAKGFAEMQRNLHGLVSQVSHSIAQLSSSSNEISTVASLAADNMHTQKDELNMLATAMNEMQATVQEIARNTNDTAKSSDEASSRADHGTGMVNTTIQSIERVAGGVEETALVITKLGEDSRNIGMVLEVIGNIADQTNLLALNAAIEAARAGEQGRGFAVVADEVRTLAKRTQESTSQINKIISELQSRSTQAIATMQHSQSMIGETVAQAREAGEAIGEISGAVSGISHMMTQVATATEEQGAVSDELNSNIVRISQASDEVAAGANEMAKACAELNVLASDLQEMVNHFKV